MSISALFRGGPGTELGLSLCSSAPKLSSDPPRANATRSEGEAPTALALISSKLNPCHVADFEALARLLQSVAVPPETVRRNSQLVSCTHSLRRMYEVD